MSDETQGFEGAKAIVAPADLIDAAMNGEMLPLVSVTVKLYDSKGRDYLFTLKDVNEYSLLDRLTQLVDRLNKLNLTDTPQLKPPEQPAPAPASAGPPPPQSAPAAPQGGPPVPPAPEASGDDLIRMEVKAISHGVTESGHHFVRAIGDPPYHKYGFKAWPEALPERWQPRDEYAGFMAWPTSDKYEGENVPEDLRMAIVDTAAKKVTRFE